MVFIIICQSWGWNGDLEFSGRFYLLCESFLELLLEHVSETQGRVATCPILDELSGKLFFHHVSRVSRFVHQVPQIPAL